MPTYACEECGKAFRSKQALREHLEEHPDQQRRWSPVGSVRNVWRTLTGFSRKQLMILFAIVLMSTLFVGTAFFASTFAPSTGGNQQGRYVNPLTGYAMDRVPDPASLSLPSGYVSGEPLGEREQIFVLVAGSADNGPAVLLQYSCTDCPDTVNALNGVARQYQGYVYVAPYPDMEQRVAATALGNIQTYESVEPEQLGQFVCSSFQRYPVRFRPLECGMLPASTGGNGTLAN